MTKELADLLRGSPRPTLKLAKGMFVANGTLAGRRNLILAGDHVGAHLHREAQRSLRLPSEQAIAFPRAASLECFSDDGRPEQNSEGANMAQTLPELTAPR